MQSYGSFLTTAAWTENSTSQSTISSCLPDAKMTKALVPSQDIDKLFVVLRRRVEILPEVLRKMSLAAMRQRYSFVGQPFAR